MKAIHPETHKVIFIDMQTGDEFLSTSTLTSEEKKTVDGVEYFVIRSQITSSSHPFYTGKSEQVIDTFDVIKKFKDRVAAQDDSKVIKKRKKIASRKGSTVEAVGSKEVVTLRDMMKQLQK